jgi:hypothetical protein
MKTSSGGILLIVVMFLILVLGTSAMSDQVSSVNIDPAYQGRVDAITEIVTTNMTAVGYGVFIVAAVITINAFRAI